VKQEVKSSNELRVDMQSLLNHLQSSIQRLEVLFFIPKTHETTHRQRHRLTMRDAQKDIAKDVSGALDETDRDDGEDERATEASSRSKDAAIRELRLDVRRADQRSRDGARDVRFAAIPQEAVISARSLCISSLRGLCFAATVMMETSR